MAAENTTDTAQATQDNAELTMPDTNLDYDVEHFADLLIGKLAHWLETGVSMIPNLVIASIVVAVFFILGNVINKTLQKVFGRVFDSRAISDLMATIGKVLIIAVGFFLALDLIGLQKAVFSLLAGAGIIGLALGFAFQDLAENLLAGLMLGVRKPFQPGDLIKSNDIFGHVERLNLRNTIVRDFDGQIIYIPNKEVFKNVLENFSQSGKRRITIGVGVSYGENLDHVEDTLRKTIEGLNFLADDKPVDIWALEFGDSSINFSVRYWINYPDGDTSYYAAIHHGVKAIKDAFDDEGIVIPFPIRTLDFGIKGGQNLAEPMGEVFEPATSETQS
ncbi:mechanosensitive ion channel family protein [Cerasicoccus fimbriatus]|uniref:mechanosensitive ion channel family protein n=1 Tax=Cerasicoccus fimbriatus TaxID=3014554 RepID=UPI0022B37032|nr:mechanosensitive ion channel family protein [Cerasicoccus sp. TK19100]